MLLTAPGVGAIAVARLTGPGVISFLHAHFTKDARPGRCVHGELRHDDRVIDDAVVVLLPGGHAADVNLHGGAWVVSSFLELAARQGFKIVDELEEMVEGETALEREVMAYLPRAKTRQALEFLLNQPRAWSAYVTDPKAGPTVPEILEDRTLWWMLHPPRVAIVGAPNVGKSTLANQLFAHERSITADLPGTTRDWVGEEANMDGLVVTLVDTPGLRETSDLNEFVAIERSSQEVRRADLVVLVLDGSRQLAGEQQNLVDQFPHALRVINKVDRASAWVDDHPEVPKTVAITGEDVDAVRTAIKSHFCSSAEIEAEKPRWWTQRQRELLEHAAHHPELAGAILR